MQTIDYQTPPEKKRPARWLYWLIFLSTYPVGMVLVDILDDVVHMMVTGHHNDGGVMVLTLVALPVFIIVVAVLRGVSKACKALPAAATFALFLPLFGYAVLAILSSL